MLSKHLHDFVYAFTKLHDWCIPRWQPALAATASAADWSEIVCDRSAVPRLLAAMLMSLHVTIYVCILEVKIKQSLLFVTVVDVTF